MLCGAAGIVDNAMPVVRHYGEMISEMELDVVSSSRPKASYTTTLHLLQSDLKAMRTVMVRRTSLQCSMHFTSACFCHQTVLSVFDIARGGGA
jgi:hypothetical protein